MNKTKIQWCTHTWNPVTGCSKISEGCLNCYAGTLHKRFEKTLGKFNEIKFHPEKLSEPKHLRKKANIFVNSISDTFNGNITDNEIDYIFDAMALTNHNYMLLTKRSERMKNYIEDRYDTHDNIIPDGIWAGVTVENQKMAYFRIPALLEIIGVHKWLSIEPLLGPVNIDNYLNSRAISWVVIGAETGNNKRYCAREWMKHVIESCKEYEVPVFVKQISKLWQKGITEKVEKDFSKFPDYLKFRQVPKELFTTLKNWKPNLEITEGLKY